MNRSVRRTIIKTQRIYRGFLDTSQNYIYRFRATEHTFMVIMAIIIGIIGGFGAVGIQFLINFFKEIFWGTDEYTIQYLATLPLYTRIGVPIFGGMVVGLIVHFFSKEAKGHGVPEVMEAIALRNGVIRARVVFSKLFSFPFAWITWL